MSLPSHTHRYLRNALFPNRHTSAVSLELDLISVVPLAKHKANVLPVKLLRELEFCDLQDRDTFDLLRTKPRGSNAACETVKGRRILRCFGIVGSW